MDEIRFHLPELITVRVFLVHVHEVVESDQVWFVVHVEDAGLDVSDVVGVVVDVVGGGLAVGEDVVVVTVVNHKHSAGLYKILKVPEAFLVIPQVSVKVRKVSEGVTQKDSSIEPSRRLDNVFIQSQPIGLLNDPVIKGGLLPSLPSGLVSTF